ncbi:phage recombination protein Bet [Microcoleus sp. Pol11C1]|uniref:phage recombination protein Bet n=1 Tax=unclassified Microcoleus TaxID=2642155 RepID=UPI002FD0C8F7
MNSNIVQVQKSELIFNESQVRLLKSTILDDQTTNDELALFSLVCGRTGLDPFARQVYGIRRKGKLTFQTSIDGYRLIADRTRKYAGSDDAIFDEGLNLYQHLESGRKLPTVATVTVWKLVENVRCPFTASASWSQYSQTYSGKLTETWAKMPHLMLSKCAESLALRKAFPAELSGIYTSEEFPAESESFADRTSAPVNPKPSTVSRSVEVLSPVATSNPAASAEVAEKLHKLKWSDFQIQNCLVANFNAVSPTDLDDDQLLDLIDYLDLFEKTSAEVRRLKWTTEQGKEVLKSQFGVESRNNLTLQQLTKFHNFLKTQKPA